ncbi:MAG: hypothetical protein UFG06_13570 [Lachnospiraceae bacterium]|nr:hypothetical protein [Lachnospiraceae bacterium]
METELITQEESQKIKEFKALYYELNAKPDTTTKVFNDKVVVKMDDLVALSDMVQEKLKLHSNEGKFGKTNVTIATSKHKVYSFDDWKIFIDHNWRISEYIESITLVWDFYIGVEGYKNPQRHKLTVKISNGLKPEEVLSLIISGSVEDIQNIEERQAPIIAQMDFIENRLGQEFINIVSEWVATLQKEKDVKNKFVLWLKGKRKLIGYYFNYVLFIIVSIVAIVGFNLYTNNLHIGLVNELTIEQMNSIINYIVISVLICCIVLNSGEAIANKIFRKLSEYGETFVFRITNGDEQQYNTISRDDRRNAIKICFNLGFSLIINILCSIIASVLYSML